MSVVTFLKPLKKVIKKKIRPRRIQPKKKKISEPARECSSVCATGATECIVYKTLMLATPHITE